MGQCSASGQLRGEELPTDKLHSQSTQEGSLSGEDTHDLILEEFMQEHVPGVRTDEGGSAAQYGSGNKASTQ